MTDDQVDYLLRTATADAHRDGYLAGVKAVSDLFDYHFANTAVSINGLAVMSRQFANAVHQLVEQYKAAARKMLDGEGK